MGFTTKLFENRRIIQVPNIGYKQLVVQVPELVLRRLKLQGYVEGKTMNDVVALVLQGYVDNLPKIMMGDKEIS